MPLPTKWNKRRQPPPGFDYVEPVLEALENELRDKVKDSNLNIRKLESPWPIHQINWQKSRYIYDLYYTYQRIDKQVYQYCIDQKLIDAALIAKWKKTGYERLCSTYVINPSNFKFGTTSICRVPWFDRNIDQKQAKDPTTGCMGCASGKNAGPRNIFGNKYGQNLAAVQIAREKRMEKKLAEAAAETERQLQANDDSDDDYGPAPTAGVWAGSQKLQLESERVEDDGEEETDDEDENATGAEQHRPSKKVRANES